MYNRHCHHLLPGSGHVTLRLYLLGYNGQHRKRTRESVRDTTLLKSGRAGRNSWAGLQPQPPAGPASPGHLPRHPAGSAPKSPPHPRRQFWVPASSTGPGIGRTEFQFWLCHSLAVCGQGFNLLGLKRGVLILHSQDYWDVWDTRGTEEC